MYLKSLYLQRFRNYGEAYFEFSPALNLFCGPNAIGKISVLEAIYYLMFGKSFRPGVHQDLIQTGSQSFYLETLFCKHEVDQKLRIYLEGKERKILYNSTLLSNVANLLGLIPGVIMTPDDVNLIKGSPPLRRQFMDIQLAQVDPLYVHYLTRYTKAMRHRNQLLKQKKLLSIETWEHEMAQAAAYIIFQRKLSLKALQIHCQKFYHYLTDEKEDLSVEYYSGAAQCQTESEIKECHLFQFSKNRSREIQFGHTLFGPHKDDILIKIGGKDVRYFASEGQQRSSVVALHMAEWEQLKLSTHDFPLLMIDDVGISLDVKRREKLIEQLSSLGQVFLTTTDSTLLDAYSGNKKVYSYPFAPTN